MKKRTTVLLAFLLAFSMLSACGGAADTPASSPTQAPATTAPDTTSDTPTASADEPAQQSAGAAVAAQYGLPATPLSDMAPAEFTIFSRNSDTPHSPDNPVIKIIEEVTNTKINYEFLVGDEDTKIGIMVASGDMPDAVFVGGKTGPFIDAGSFLALEDLFDQNAPNLRSFYSPWWEGMKHSDGHIYIAELFSTPVGTQYVMEHWGSAMWIQKDVLDHFGRAPSSVDEYFDFIREYMALNPTINGAPTRGFEILATGYKWIDNPPLFLAGFPNWGGVYVDEATDTAYTRFAADFVKPWLQKLNEEFRAGTIPADTLTLTQDQYHANIATGTVLAMHDQKWAFNSAQNTQVTEGNFNRTFLPIGLTYDGVESNYVDSRQFTGNNGLGISKNCSDPVRFAQYMDYLIQEPVQKLLTWGIEGINYNYEDGRMVRPQEQRDLQADSVWRKDNLGQMLYDLMPKMQGSFSDGNATTSGEQPEEYFAGLQPYDKDLFAKLGIMTEAGFMGTPKERPSYYPVWSMTIEDGSSAKVGEQRVAEINDRMQARLITCEAGEFDTIWDEYVAAVATSGVEDYIVEVNRQIAERKASRAN